MTSLSSNKPDVPNLLNREKIYIVEDSYLASAHLQKLLEREGYLISGCSDNAETALTEIRDLQPDMVLMDIMLSGEMGGVEAARQIKEELGIPLIYITALTDKSTIQAAKFTEPYGYLIKPFDDQEILTVVEMGLYKAKQDRYRNQKITEEVLRDKELAELNQQIADLRMDALHSVMNPHFIFNALNSIQYFIAQQDRVNALNYLSSFSKLIRSILNHSTRGRILLLDEVEMLQNYVALEQLRFENKFEFNIHVDPALDLNNIEIPALLIQPYLENSILHGMSNKKDKGRLTLTITEKQGLLVFKIEDNGPSHDTARKLTDKLPRPDVGLVSEERLKLIAQNSHAQVQIMNPENGIGNCIVITLPLSVKQAN